MSAYTNRNDLQIKFAQGMGYVYQTATTSTVSGSAAAANSGQFSVQMQFNLVGSTVPGTLVGFPIPPSPSSNLSILMTMYNGDGNSARGVYLARLYTIGTVALTSTGNQFTRDAGWTGPLLRTQLGQASQPISLIPYLFVTTATSVTAPSFIIRNATGPASGYTNQVGSTITGTKTFTFPAAATVTSSGFILRLEDGDSGVRDISNIDIQTASTTGAATIYGIELLAPMGLLHLSMASVCDTMTGGLQLPDANPAAATTGTVPTLLAAVTLSTSGAIAGGITIIGVLNA